MQVILQRRGIMNDPTLFAHQPQDYFKQIIFAHISNLVRVDHVQISKKEGFHGMTEEITLVLSPQPGVQNNAALKGAILSAISLRGDLELVAINMNSNDFTYRM